MQNAHKSERGTVMTAALDDIFVGSSELAELMRACDWSSTPLGPPEAWPQALRTCVRILLTSRQPMWLGWGEQLTYLYNDAYKSIIGGKHPWALGRPTRAVWHEIWEEIGPRIEMTMHGREGTYDEALLLMMERHGYREETYYTFSYSPIPDDAGGVGGLLCANTDDTQRIVGERQLAVLRELGARTVESRTVLDACQRSAGALETNPHDLPFGLIYLLEADAGEGRRAVLAGTANVPPDHAAAPSIIALDDVAHADERKRSGVVWPVAEVLRASAPRLLDLQSSPGLPTGAWDRSPSRAVAWPIATSGETGKSTGILIVGLNPYRVYDDTYRGFLELVTAQIAAAISSAQAYEEERRRVEALAELDRAKTVFFSNVSHEFRTPLTLMLGPIEDLLAGSHGQLSNEQQEQLRVAHRNSLRLLRLVNTLLDFSRIEAGRVEAWYEQIDIAAYTADLASSFRSAIERAGLQLVVHCPPLPFGIEVYVDREMWEKVVLNLVSNALKFTFEGEVAIRLQPGPDCKTVQLEVRDTGTGIPEDELPRLFERFHRVQGARARTHEGTGIGLALVQELVRLHGGEVQVESRPGRGTSVSVTLPTGTAHLPQDRIGSHTRQRSMATNTSPFVEEALRWLPGEVHLAEDSTDGIETARSRLDVQHAPASATAAEVGRRRARVLLADDNADMRAYVSRLLAPRYAVEAVRDGVAALEAARTRTPDLVLADIMMPGLDGFGLLHALREDPRTRELPVVLLSARAGEEATVEGIQAGADDYLVKPFAARELLARVSSHLELSHLRAAAGAAERAARQHAEAIAQRNEQLYQDARTLAEARDRALAEVEAARQQLREVFMQAPAIICVLRGAEHVYELVNPAYLEAIGCLHPEEVLGKRVRDVLPELEAQGYLALLDRVYHTAEPYVGSELPVRRDRHGTDRPEERIYNFVYQPLRDVNGEVDGILVHAVDVTQQVRAREAVRRQAHLLDLTHDAIFAWEFGGPGRAGPITFWNPACVELYGYTADEALGRVSHDLLRTRHPQGMPHEFEALLERAGEWQGELIHTTGARARATGREPSAAGFGT